MVPRKLRGLLALGSLIVGLGCQQDRTAELLRLVPGLEPEFAFHVVNDDSVALRAYTRVLGVYGMETASLEMLWALPASSVAEFVAVDSIVGPYFDRAVWAHTSESGNRAAWEAHRAWRRRSRAEQLDILRLRRTPKGIEDDPDLAPDLRLEKYQRFFEACRPYTDAIDTGLVHGRAAELLFQLNRPEVALHELDLGIEVSRRLGGVEGQCQLLGKKAAYVGTKGDVDSMFAYLERGIRIARRFGSPSEARLLRYSGGFWRSLGRPLRSIDLDEESAAVAAAHGDEFQEAYAVIEMGWGLAQLSCWDLALQNVQRAEAIVRRGSSDLRGSPLTDLVPHTMALRLECLAESSDPRAVLPEAGRLLGRISWHPPSMFRERAVIAVARTFRRSGNPRFALQVLRESRARCERDNLLAALPAVLGEMATTALELRDYALCAQIVHDYRNIPNPPGLPSDEAQIDVCSVEVTAALQGSAAAVDTLGAILQRYKAWILDGSWRFELALAAPTSLLRRATYRALQHDAEAEYAFEMEWRKLFAVPSETAKPTSLVRVRPDSDVAAVPATAGGVDLNRAAHCVYAIVGDDIVRWTVRDGQITRDVLPVSASEAQRVVDELVDAIASSGASGQTPAISASARRLAAWLLPTTILQGVVPERLFVTPDGFLCRLPFGLLNLADDSFRPLVQECDIATVRYWRDESVATAPRSALLVIGPTYDPKVRRAYPSLNHVLPASEREATTFARFIPRSEILSGLRATKAEVIARWGAFDCLYFASHILQHPRLPFLYFIPLADPSSSATLADAYLEPADIRAADLSHCQLVVLSGCSSAVPYPAPNGVEPSLGDAFVDAGARCVISTLWDVTDADAAALMSQFAQEYEHLRTDPVAALGTAQREFVRRGASPAQWAAYTATVAGATAGSVRAGELGVASDTVVARPDLPRSWAR